LMYLNVSAAVLVVSVGNVNVVVVVVVSNWDDAEGQRGNVDSEGMR